MAVYIVDKFEGGIASFNNRGVEGSFKMGKNLDIRKETDSLTCNQVLVDEGLYGSKSPSLSVSPSASISASPSVSPSTSVSNTASPTASPSASPSTTPSVSISSSPSNTPSSSVSKSPSPSAGLDTVFEDLIHFFVKSSDGYTYGFGNAGCIYRRDSDAFWQRVYKDTNGEIKGAEEKPSDSGKIYLYWATNTKLMRKPLPGLSNWNDVEIVAQNLQSQDWHTMKQINGALMICNGSYLAMVGYDDSYTNEALDLIPGNISKTLVERNGRTIIGTGRLLDSTKSINGAIDTEVPLIQAGDDGELYFADMNSSIPTKRFPGGGKVNPGGVCNEVEQVNLFEWEETALSWIDKQSVGNLALFAVYSADTGYGGIYSYGRKNKDKPFVLNLEYHFDTDELGAITTVNGTTIVSYKDGTDFGVKAVDQTTKATGTYEGLEYKSKIKKPVNITQWKYAEVFCEPIVSGTSIEYWYKLNKTGDFIQAKMEDGNTDFSNVNETKAVFLIGEEADIYEPKVILNPTGNTSPEVYFIKTYFE